MFRQIIKGSLFIGFGKVADIFVVILTLPFLITNIGVDNVGVINGSLALSMFFGSLVQYGFLLTGSRDIAGINEKKTQNEYVSTVLFVQVLFLFSGCILYFSIYNFFIFSRENYLVCFIFCIAAMCRSIVPVYYFQGTGRFYVFPIINLIVKLLYIVLVYLIVEQDTAVEIVAYIFLLANFIMLLLSIIYMKSALKFRFVKPTVTNVIGKIKGSLDVFLINFSPGIYNYSSIFILASYSDPVLFGVYSTAVRLVETCITVGNSVNEVALPVISKTKNESKSNLIRVAGVVFGVVISACVFIFSDLVEFYIMPNVGGLSYYLKLLALWPIFIFIRNSYGINGLIYNRLESTYRRIVISMSIIGLVLMLIFVPLYSVMGAYYVLIFTAGTMAILTYVFFKVKE